MTAKNPTLTDANREQIEYMREFLSENDRLPNRREFNLSFSLRNSEHYGWASHNAADLTMKKFVQLGVIEPSGSYYYRFVRPSK